MVTSATHDGPSSRGLRGRPPRRDRPGHRRRHGAGRGAAGRSRAGDTAADHPGSERHRPACWHRRAAPARGGRRHAAPDARRMLQAGLRGAGRRHARHDPGEDARPPGGPVSVRPAAWIAAALALAAPLIPVSAQAATITIQSVDSAGEGFNDTTPATPVGGNQGTTIGDQRMNVCKKAAQLWGDALISVPPIVVAASFAPLSCNTNQIMLGQAAFTTSRANTPGAPPGFWIPIALANALAGMDLNGTADGDEEIDAMFNGGLSQCSMNLQNWYYGLDGMAGDDIDLLSVVLHEFGHGLGFASVLDPTDGVAPYGMLDVFTSNVFDNGAKMAWTDMTDSQRGVSAATARHLVWTGQTVQRKLPQILAQSSPTLTATPAPTGRTGHVSEGEFGPYLSMKPVSGVLKVSNVTSPCSISGSLTTAIALFPSTNQCPPVQIAAIAQQAGAVGALFEDGVGADPPFAVSVLPSIQNYGPVKIPVASVSSKDRSALA